MRAQCIFQGIVSLSWLSSLAFGAFLQTQGHSQIPQQLVLTGKAATWQELPPHLHQNVRRMLNMNPGLRTRYLGDTECRNYLKKHYSRYLAELYEQENRGQYRGDICRAGVLLKEGGFYADVDLEPQVPFTELVDSETTFMAVFAAKTPDQLEQKPQVLNALIAVTPGNQVLRKQLKEVQDWYRGDFEESSPQGPGEFMGPLTLMKGLEHVMKDQCPTVDLARQQNLQDTAWRCGKEGFRIYQEANLCSSSSSKSVCPPERRNSAFEGAHFGIYRPGVDPTQALIAWSRSASCKEWWCGSHYAPAK